MAKRKRGPIAELGRGLRQMTPNRITARYASGGKHQTWGAIARAALKAQPSQPIPMRPVPWGSPLPRAEKSAQRSRDAAAKKVTQPVIKKTVRGKQVAKRKSKGHFDGSVVLPGADLSLYREAQSGRAVIQPGEPNRRRL